MATTTQMVYLKLTFVILIFGVRNVYVSGTCSGELLSATSGTLMCPSSGASVYSNNMNVTWILQNNDIYKIKFSKLDVELNFDKVHLYGGPIKTSKRFTLMNADVVNSEYYIPGPIRINFVTDGSTTKSGFLLAYETVPFSFSVPTEVIRQSSGLRDSHPEFSTGNYSDNFRMAWSIYVPSNNMVTIEFIEFNTEGCCDVLRIYSGGIIPYQEKTFSGNLPSFKLHFVQNVTLFFSTDGSVVARGFRFRFEVTPFTHLPRKINSEFHNWTGKLSRASSFILQLQPLVLPGTNVYCQIQAACGIRSANFSLQTLDKQTFRPGGHVTLLPCISSMVCTIQWRSESMQLQINVPHANPESARIELINPKLWSLTGVIQFRAVSDASCPNVRHQCELRTANGTSLTAQPVDWQVSQPDVQHCSCNVTTQFAVVSQFWLTAAHSVIFCRLNNGSFVEHGLPVFTDTSTLTSPMQRHLLLATSATAVVSLIVTFGLACALAVQSDCWRNLTMARDSAAPAGFDMTAQGTNQQTEDVTCEVYDENTMMDSSDVYVA